MRRYALHFLVLVNLSLVAFLGWLWLDAKGHPRNIHWQAPAAQKPDLAGLVPTLPSQDTADVSRFMAALDRPLFSPTRRPPPPVVVVAPAPPPPPDPLDSLQLFGLFAGKDDGGILARVDGKTRRVHFNETVGEWVLTSIDDRDVKFMRGQESRVLRLVRIRQPVPAVASAPGNPANPGSPSTVPTAGPSMAQKLEEEGRERLRLRNEIFRKAGLPPVSP